MHGWIVSALVGLTLAQAAPEAHKPAGGDMGLVAPAMGESRSGVAVSQVAASAVCPLTGLMGDPAKATRNPLGVMVENTVSARPQSGLDKAEVVVEAHVEGGVTRFYALFVCEDAEVVGPVRSTRQVFVSWGRALGAFVAHAWALPSAYDLMDKLKVRNIDGVRLRGVKTPYHRVEARRKPHNLYTSTAELRRYAAERKYTDRPFTGSLAHETLFAFKDGAASASPTHRWFGFDLHGLTYFAHFEWVPETNRYRRFLAGWPHMSGSAEAKRPKKKLMKGAAHTKDSQSQIEVDNVLVVVTKEWIVTEVKIKSKDPDVPDKKAAGVRYRTTGGGKAILFRDGVRIDGRWERKSDRVLHKFVAEDGTELELNRGQTWIVQLPREDDLVFEVPAAYAKKLEKRASK